MLEDFARAIFEEQTAGMTESYCEASQWVLFSAAFPVLDVGFDAPGMVPLRIRLDARRYNAEPPAVTLCDWGGRTLDTLPRSGGIFNNSAHPVTQLPFVCMVGTNEYHTHPSHITDSWPNYRDGRTLGSIIFQIEQGWQQTWRQ